MKIIPMWKVMPTFSRNFPLAKITMFIVLGLWLKSWILYPISLKFGDMILRPFLCWPLGACLSVTLNVIVILSRDVKEIQDANEILNDFATYMKIRQ